MIQCKPSHYAVTPEAFKASFFFAKNEMMQSNFFFISSYPALTEVHTCKYTFWSQSGIHSTDKVILYLFLCISCFMWVDTYLQSQAWDLD